VNGCAIIAKKRKRRTGLKDAITGWALVSNPWILKVRTFCFVALAGALFSAAISSRFELRNQTSIFKPS